MAPLKVLLLAVLLAPLAPPLAAARESPDKYHEVSAHLATTGFEALDGGRIDEAIRAFEQAMVADPGNVDVYIGLGRSYYRAGSFGFSVRYYDNALAIDPINRAALEGQGIAYLAMDSPDRAKANLEKLRTICGANGCKEATRLAGEIDKFDKNDA